MGPTSPGEDFYEALMHAWMDFNDGDTAYEDSLRAVMQHQAWSTVTPAGRTVFEQAAARFLSME